MWKLHFSLECCISATVAAWFLQPFWLTTHTHAAAWLRKSCNQCVQLGAVGRGEHGSGERKVESAAAVGLCCTHNAPVCQKTPSSEFPLSQGNAEALGRWGGKTKHHLLSYFLVNTSAKHYCNRIVCVKIIASQRWTFLRHKCIFSHTTSCLTKWSPVIDNRSVTSRVWLRI